MHLANRKALVTGAGGFIGTHLVKHLTAKGTSVSSVYRNQAHAPPAGQFEICDLSDYEKTLNLLLKIQPDIIFHFAGAPLGSRGIDVVQKTFVDNLVSSVNVMLAACKVGCERMVIAGSMEEPTNLHQTGNFQSPYAISKWATSVYANFFDRNYGLPFVLLRIFMVYGPGYQSRNRLIPYVINSFLDGKVPSVSSGKRLIDWIYIDDLIEGIIKSSTMPDINGEVIDMGSGELISIQDLLESIKQTMKVDINIDFGEIPDRENEIVRKADIKRTKNLIDWKPKTPINQGIKFTRRCPQLVDSFSGLC